jgi:hypothetical protein
MPPKITWERIATILGIIVTIAGLIWRMEANHTDAAVQNALLKARIEALEKENCDLRLDALERSVNILQVQVNDENKK